MLVSQSLLFTSAITPVGHAECWKLPLCEKEAQNLTFSLCSSLAERGGSWQEKGKENREGRLLREGGRGRGLMG